MRIKKYMFFIVILIGSLIGSANMKEVKAEDSESIEDIVELSLLYSGRAGNARHLFRQPISKICKGRTKDTGSIVR